MRCYVYVHFVRLVNLYVRVTRTLTNEHVIFSGLATQQSCYIQWGISLHKVRRPFDDVVLQGHLTNKNMSISTTTMVIANKLLYNEEIPSIKSQNLLITWSFKVTWQINYVISLLPQNLRSLNLAKWWVTIRGFHL